MNTPRVAASAGGFGQRVATALVLAPLAVLAVLYLPPPWFALVFGALFALGLWEWTRLSGLVGRWRRALAIALFALLLTGLWHGRDALWLPLCLLGAGFWLLALLWLGRPSLGHGAGRATVALKLLAGLLALAPAWLAAVHLDGDGPRGALWVLYVMTLIWCADIFAYLAGRRFGNRKLAPLISPGKTWAGVYGALLGASLYALLLGISHLHLRYWMLFGFVGLSLLCVAVSIVGDLFESLIKRQAGVKDSGHIFPGHGGVFDRFDSLFAALSWFTLGKLWLGL